MTLPVVTEFRSLFWLGTLGPAELARTRIANLSRLGASGAAQTPDPALAPANPTGSYLLLITTLRIAQNQLTSTFVSFMQGGLI